MDVKYLFDLFVGMVAVAIALSIASTHLVAAICLVLYASLIVFRYESKRFGDVGEEYARELSFVKLVLLLVALADVFL